MKNLILLTFILITSLSFSQTLVIDTKMNVTSFQVKHMEANQYNQMSEENIDSNYIVIYYEEYQAYDIVINNEYHLTFKIKGKDYSTILKEEDIQIICSCSYEFLDIGESKILSITF